MLSSERLAKEEEAKKKASMDNFYNIMKETQERAERGEDSDGASELKMDDGLAHPENHEPPTLEEIDDDYPEGTVRIVNQEVDKEIKTASDALANSAEDVDFEDVDFEEVPD